MLLLVTRSARYLDTGYRVPQAHNKKVLLVPPCVCSRRISDENCDVCYHYHYSLRTHPSPEQQRTRRHANSNAIAQ